MITEMSKRREDDIENDERVYDEESDENVDDEDLDEK
jgi:hypothetical protein